MNRPIVLTALILCFCCASSVRGEPWTSADGVISVTPPVAFRPFARKEMNQGHILESWQDADQTAMLAIAEIPNPSRLPFDSESIRKTLAGLLGEEVTHTRTVDSNGFSLFYATVVIEVEGEKIYYEVVVLPVGLKSYMVSVCTRGKDVFDSVPIRRFVDSITVDPARVNEIMNPSKALNWMAIGIGIFFVLLILAVLMYSASGSAGPKIEIEYPD